MPTATITSPADAALVPQSGGFPVAATVTPPGAVAALFDSATGFFLGAAQSDGAGHALLMVDLSRPGGPWAVGESSSDAWVASDIASSFDAPFDVPLG